MNTPGSRRHGYVLIMCLFVLAFAGVALSIVAQRSARAAIAANSRTSELKRRWLTHSIATTLLRQPQELLAGRPSGRRNWHFELDGEDVKLELIDESAKLNVNTVWRASASPQSVLPANIRFALSTGDVTSWAQIDTREWRETEYATLTCWTNGLTNIYTASDETIDAICKVLEAPDVQDVLKRIRNTRETTVKSQLAALPVRVDVRQQLQSMLTDRSTCYVVKIAAYGNVELIVGSDGQLIWLH